MECLSSSCSSSTEITHPADTSSGVHRCAGVPFRSVRDVNLQTISNAARTGNQSLCFYLSDSFQFQIFKAIFIELGEIKHLKWTRDECRPPS